MIQLQFLNKLISSKDSSLLLVNNLTKDFFSDYLDEYEYITNHINDYGNLPDIESFITKFPNFPVLDVSETSSYLLDELYKDKNARELAKTFNKVKELFNKGDIDEAMKVYISAANSAVEATHMTCIDITKDTSRYEDYLDKCEDFSKYYVKTGFTELDMVIGGWDRLEELATIVARPNVGKSWILLKCAVSALEQGLNVGLYSGEMSEKKVGYRFDTLTSHIANSSITKGNRDIQNIYKKYIDELPNKYKGTLKVLTPTMIGGSAGVTALRAFIEKEKLDILFIDQHSLLEDDRHAKTPFEKASNISKDLKNLQVLKKIPIISVSQQNRASTSENGATTAHVAQSDRIAQDSTILIFLEMEDGILSLDLVKSRDSDKNKSIKYAVSFNTGVFTYIPEENNALNGDGVQSLQEEFEEGQDYF